MTGPSSYIPTLDAPVTRAADNVSRALGSEFNPEQFTLFWEGILPNESSTLSNYIWQISTSPRLLSTSSSLLVWRNGGSIWITKFAPSGTAISTVATDQPSSGYLRIAASFEQGKQSLAVNGASFSDLHGGLPSPESLTQLGLSINSGSDRERIAGSLRYIPRALSEAELIELTGASS